MLTVIATLVAEGLEDGPAFELLHGMGAIWHKATFIARPMPLAELMAFLARGERMAVQKLAG